MDALSLSTALAGVLSGRDGRELQIKVGKQAMYDPASDTMYLPGLPIGEVNEETKLDLLAYMAHESGERGISGWDLDDPRWKDKPALRGLVNGISDAYVDRAQLEAWPGAGLAIKSRVQKDWDRVQKNGGYGAPDMGKIAHALRLIGDRVATIEDIAKSSPEMGKVLNHLRPTIEAIDFDSQESCINGALQIYNTLRPAEQEEPKPEPQSGGESDEKEKSDKSDSKSGQSKDKKPADKTEIGKESDSGESGDGTKGEGADAEGEDEDGEAEADGDGESEPTESDGSGEDAEEGEAGAGGSQIDRDIDIDIPVIGDGRGYIPSEEEVLKRLDKSLGGDGKVPTTYTSHPDLIRRHKPMKGTSRAASRACGDIVNRLTRELRDLLKVEDRAVVRRQRFGELDGSKLLNAVVRGEESVMQRRGRDQVESLAVYVSLDMTGSMCGRITSQSRLALSLNEALGKLQIPTKMVGWKSDRSSPVDTEHLVQGHTSRLHDFKDWDERWNNDRVTGSLATMIASGGNADVDALADGINALTLRPERRKILLFMTDGQPCMDFGGCCDFYTQQKLLYDALRKLGQKAEKYGITMILCGIDMGEHEIKEMAKLYGEDRVVSVESYAMPDTVSTLFLKKLKALVQGGRRRKAWSV